MWCSADSGAVHTLIGDFCGRAVRATEHHAIDDDCCGQPGAEVEVDAGDPPINDPARASANAAALTSFSTTTVAV